MRCGCFVAVFCVLFWASAVRASVIAGPVVNPRNGHTYLLLSQEDWTEAEAEAMSLGGTLATIRSPAENSFVSDTFGGSRNLWIGLWDPSMDSGSGNQHAANFAWAGDDASSYRNWSPGEPNNVNGQSEWYTSVGLHGRHLRHLHPLVLHTVRPMSDDESLRNIYKPVFHPQTRDPSKIRDVSRQ